MERRWVYSSSALRRGENGRRSGSCYDHRGTAGPATVALNRLGWVCQCLHRSLAHSLRGRYIAQLIAVIEMPYLLSAFKAVSVIFAISAVVTGAQSIVDPVGFSLFFGLPLTPAVAASDHRDLTASYIALMGVRQLATGVTLLVFAYQSKWTEVATILAIIGVLVAGTDGIFLSRAGHGAVGRWHAIPGVLIAALAAAVVYQHRD